MLGDEIIEIAATVTSTCSAPGTWSPLANGTPLASIDASSGRHPYMQCH